MQEWGDARRAPYAGTYCRMQSPGGVPLAGSVTNIEEATLRNTDFRCVLYTAEHMQLVVMSLAPGEDIGEEVHHLDQFIRVEAGQGAVVLNGERQDFPAGHVVVVPAGTRHNIVNTSSRDPLKLYTIYAPPAHPAHTVHAMRADAVAAEAREHAGRS